MKADDNARSVYASDLTDLDKVTAKVNRARAALADLEAEAKRSVAKALRSCLAAGGNRTEVQKHSPFSPPVVRAIGEDAGIPPDERYVRSAKAPPASAPALAVVPTPADSEPILAPVLSRVDQLTREAELLAMADELTSEQQAEVEEFLRTHHAPWVRLVERPGMTAKELIRLGIRNGKLTAINLRK